MQLVQKNNISQSLSSLKSDLKLMEIAKGQLTKGEKPCCSKTACSNICSPKK